MHAAKLHADFTPPFPISISGRTIGIHGLGVIAHECIRLFKPFSNTIQCWSRDVPQSVYDKAGVKKARSLAALFKENDIVIEVEALTPSTNSSVTAEMLLQMRPGAIFVNVGRGAVLEEGAVEALAARGDVSMGLDVYRKEPLARDSSLRGLSHVMLLPHVAGPTVDQYGDILALILDFLDDYLSEKPLADVISLEAYNRMT